MVAEPGQKPYWQHDYGGGVATRNMTTGEGWQHDYGGEGGNMTTGEGWQHDYGGGAVGGITTATVPPHLLYRYTCCTVLNYCTATPAVPAVPLHCCNATPAVPTHYTVTPAVLRHLLYHHTSCTATPAVPTPTIPAMLHLLYRHTYGTIISLYRYTYCTFFVEQTLCQVFGTRLTISTTTSTR